MKIENPRETYHQTLENLTEGDVFTFVDENSFNDENENETFFMKLSLKDIVLTKLSQKVITAISQLLKKNEKCMFVNIQTGMIGIDSKEAVVMHFPEAKMVTK